MSNEKEEVPIKKVAIVGCSDSKDQAPYGDESWEIWGMNNAFVHIQRRAQWFEIHPIKEEGGKYYRREVVSPGVFRWTDNFRGQPMTGYMQSLADLDIPVYMQREWDIIPKSVAYPLEEVTQKFGSYFTNSVSYMIALAILQGATEIGCWGVDMATGSEYGPQRPSCEFFLGIAAGLGIKITVPPEADLLKTKFLYGFGEREQMAWEAKMVAMMAGMEARKQKALKQVETGQAQAQQYIGAQTALQEVQRVWSNLADTKIWRDLG